MLSNLDTSEKKKCSVCGSDAFRLVSKEYGKKTYYAFEESEVIDMTEGTARPTLAKLLLRAFGCGKCGHMDFYTYVASEDIRP